MLSSQLAKSYRLGLTFGSYHKKSPRPQS